MECLLCLEINDVTYRLLGDDGVQRNIQTIIKKYFSSFIQVNDDKNHSICLRCWQRVKEFDEYYVHIESVHQYLSMPVLPILDIGQDIKLENIEADLNESDNELSLNEDDFQQSTISYDSSYEPTAPVRVSSRKKVKKGDKKLDQSKSRKYVSDKKPQRCEVCDIWLANAHKFYRHNKQFHLVLEFKCTASQCVESYATQSELAEHVKIHQKHSCSVCRKKVINLKHHRCHNSNVKLFVCEICGHTSTAKDVYNAHYEAKHMNVTYECDICGERFTNKPRIKFHMREQHVKTDKTAVCNVCGKILKNRRSLATHYPVHFEDLKNRFKCSICGKGFPKKDKLKEHETIHTGVLPLQCAFCDKRFRFSSSLSLHRKKEHSNQCRVDQAAVVTTSQVS